MANYCRRRFLAAAAASCLPVSLVRAEGDDDALKVGVYGGYFKQAFEEHIFQLFSEETGIAVEAVAEPAGKAWLDQVRLAARAGEVLADVSMVSQVSALRGIASGLWRPLDTSVMEYAGNVHPRLILRHPDRTPGSIGAMSWNLTLATNTNVYPSAPSSWRELWGADSRGRVGLLAEPSASYLLEIAAAAYFGGTQVLDDEEGIVRVMEKIAQLAPNVARWYRDESLLQQDVLSGDVPMGQHYHDVIVSAAAEGAPIRSTFPSEGGVLDSCSWVVTRSSAKVSDALLFIDFMCRPGTQDLLARSVGVAPVVRRDLLSLSEDEFALVSSVDEPILPRYDMHDAREEWIAAKWSEIVALHSESDSGEGG